MPLSPLSDPTSARTRLRGLALGLGLTGGLGASLLVVNGMQLASVVVRPFSRRTFRAVNRWIADTWWGWTVRAAKDLHGVELVVTGDDVPPREDAILVANHQQMPDITLIMMLARTKGRLGDLKWIAKRPIRYVPGVGWGLAFLDSVFVSRDWTADRGSIERTFAGLRDDRVPMWLVTFPEGTRVSADKVARSQDYAHERGWPELQHVLVPRTKGFAAAVIGLRGHATAVYDVTIGYEEGAPTLWQFVRGFAHRAHLHVRRYPIDTLPEDEAGLAEWLLARFREKDALLARYYATGRLG